MGIKSFDTLIEYNMYYSLSEQLFMYNSTGYNHCVASRNVSPKSIYQSIDLSNLYGWVFKDGYRDDFSNSLQDTGSWQSLKPSEINAELIKNDTLKA